MGLFRGNDQRDRDLRPVRQEVTISSTTNGFDYQISIIHFLPMLKSESTFTFQKKKKNVLCFARPLKMYICCSTNMHFNLRQTALSIHHSKLKVFWISLLLEHTALFSHQVIVITREQHSVELSEATCIKLSHVPQLYPFHL